MRNGYCKNLNSLLYIFILIIPTWASAGNLGLVLGGGTNMTTGALQKNADYGYAGVLAITYQSEQDDSKALAIVGQFGYHSFPTESADDYKIITGEINLKLDRIFSTVPNMYLIGGGGLAKVEYGFKETSPMLSIGVGVETGQLVFETRVVRIFGEQIKETTFIPFTIGVRF